MWRMEVYQIGTPVIQKILIISFPIFFSNFLKKKCEKSGGEYKFQILKTKEHLLCCIASKQKIAIFLIDNSNRGELPLTTNA